MKTDNLVNLNDYMPLSDAGASSNSPSIIYKEPIIKTKTIEDISESEVPENYAQKLWQGYDSIQECYNNSFHDNIRKELEQLKEQAKNLDERGNGAISFNFGGFEMQMQATAPKGSKYQVKDDDMIFLIADTSKSWAVSIRYLSAGLAEHGFKALQRKAQIILKNVGHFNGDDYVRLSRVDVCVDFKSKPISRQLKPSLLDGLIAPKQSKARIFDKLDVFVRKGTIETLTLGTKGNLEISVYDKSKEITESSGKTWFYKLWNLEPKEAKKDVYRVEVRFWRNYLRNRNIKTFEEFVAYQKELINGAMYNYRLTVVNPNDTNRSRWSYHPIWVIARRELCNNCEEVLTVGRVVEGRSDILARQQTKQGAGLIRNINILYNNGTYKESFTPVIFGMLLRAMEEDDNHDRKVRLAKERYKYVDEAR